MVYLPPRNVLRAMLLLIVLFCSVAGASTVHAALDIGLDSELPEVASMEPSDGEIPVIFERGEKDFTLQMVDDSTSGIAAFGVIQPSAVACMDEDGRWLTWMRERLSEVGIQQVIEVVPIEGKLKSFVV